MNRAIPSVTDKSQQRRSFLKTLALSFAALIIPGIVVARDKLDNIKDWVVGDGYRPADHRWGMGLDISKCIGCGRCVDACKKENNVPLEPFFFRTWVERYRILSKGETLIDSPGGAIDSFRADAPEDTVLRSFFVPKLCNQCEHAPCVQVCPVGATFSTPDGVVLVDAEHCVGCRYCIQACPYGARFLHPETRTAEKCTFCYHRVTKGLAPACVEACPTQARVFGEVEKKASPLVRFLRMNKIAVLKPFLNTKPQVYYTGFDMEVR